MLKCIYIIYLQLILVYAKIDWCFVQSDNRQTDQVKISFNSVFKQSFKYNYTHMAYNCYGKGTSKPAILLHSCNQCNNIIWMDSDAILSEDFNLEDIKNFISKYPKLNMILGTDFKDTNERVRKNKESYTDYFNDGVFYVRCESNDILKQWKSYTETAGFKSDQQALQWMSKPNSIFNDQIKYDFEFFGAYSKHIKHYPGKYRRKFKLTKTTSVAHIKYCPFDIVKHDTGKSFWVDPITRIILVVAIFLSFSAFWFIH